MWPPAIRNRIDIWRRLRLLPKSLQRISGMSATEHTVALGLNERNVDFSFLPSALIAKCKHFIETYHELNGYSSLVVILWHPDIRNFLEINECLKQMFRKSTSSRSVKKTNQGLITVATAILSVEIMSSGFAGWAQRFPSAHRKAGALLRAYVPNSRTRLMDQYLYPKAFAIPGALLALSPPESTSIENSMPQLTSPRFAA